MNYEKINLKYNTEKEISNVINTLDQYSKEVKEVPELKDYLSYFLKLPGKRKRLIKLIAFSKICNGKLDDNLRHIINALEFSNAAIFVDDDIIDHDVLRKGKPTLNKIIGDEKTILIGNMLFILSIREIQKINCNTSIKEEIVDDFSKSLFKENTGQYMDLLFRNNFDGKKIKDWETMVINHSGYYVISALKAIAKISGKPEFLKSIRSYEQNCTLAGAAEDALVGFIGKEKSQGDIKNKNFTILVSYLDEKDKKANLQKAILGGRAMQRAQEYINLKISNGIKYLENFPDTEDKKILRFILEDLGRQNDK